MGPLVAWLIGIINKKFRRYSHRIQDSMGDITRIAKETLEAPRVIKVYNAEDYQAAQFEGVNEHNRRSHMRLVLTKGLSNPVVQMVTATGSAIVLSIAIADAINGRTQHGRSARVLRRAGEASRNRCASLVGVAGPLQRRASRPGRVFSSCSMSTAEPEGGKLQSPKRRAGRDRISE